MLLYVEAPIVSYRNPYAVDFGESYLYPSPSTVYGMLLSLVGECDKNKHSGVKLAIALASKPTVNTTMRTHWRNKNGLQSKPDIYEYLYDNRYIIGINSSNEKSNLKLEERVTLAIYSPNKIDRFGIISLGESRNVVDMISEYNDRYLGCNNEIVKWLKQSANGNIVMTVWPGNVADKSSRFDRFIEAEDTIQNYENFLMEIKL